MNNQVLLDFYSQCEREKNAQQSVHHAGLFGSQSFDASPSIVKDYRNVVFDEFVFGELENLFSVKDESFKKNLLSLMLDSKKNSA